MEYSKELLVLELVWEYNYTPEKANEVVSSYLDNDKYDLLIGMLAAKSAQKITTYKEE